MRLLKLLAAAVAAAVLTSAPASANPPNALDAYVAKPDPSFGWSVDHAISGPGYHGAVLNHTPLPDYYSWRVREDGAIVVRSDVKPLAVNLWQATNPKARDFRVDTIGKAFTSTPLEAQGDGTYVAKVAKPASGYTAYFVELVYPSGTPFPFKFTTEVSVIPDVLPYKWRDARPITAPDGK